MKMKNNALLLMIVLTTVICIGLGAYLKYDVLVPFDLYQEDSVIQVPFLLLSDKAKLNEVLESKYPAQPTEPQTEPTEAPTEPPTEAETEISTEPVATEPDVQTPTELPTEPPTEAPTEPIVVDESWFDDAIFIGDSRSQHMSAYARLGKAHYFGDAGLSVMNIRFKKCYIEGYSKILLPDLLSQHKYGKIYVMLGINSMYENSDRVIEEYQVLIDLIKEKQPDATIILHSIMTVSRYKAASEKYYSLESLHGMNERISELAAENGLFYIDVNEMIADEEGYLPSNMSKDGVHLYGKYYKEWAQWLVDKASTFGIP